MTSGASPTNAPTAVLPSGAVPTAEVTAPAVAPAYTETSPQEPELEVKHAETAVKAERADQQDAGSAALVMRDSIGERTSGAPLTKVPTLSLIHI